jgi:hypothetical protein
MIKMDDFNQRTYTKCLERCMTDNDLTKPVWFGLPEPDRRVVDAEERGCKKSCDFYYRAFIEHGVVKNQ